MSRNNKLNKLVKILFFTGVISVISFLIFSGLQPKSIEFVILAINDPHSHILPFKIVEDGKTIETGGLGRVEALIRKERESIPKNVPVFLFEGGDMVTGVSAKFFSDSPEYQILKTIGFDAGVLGNHEFDQGTKILKDLSVAGMMPIFASNLTFDDPELQKKFSRTEIIEKNGLKIGMFGFVATDLKTITMSLNGVSVRSDLDTLARGYIAELKSKGADVIIALNHIGLSEDIALAENVAGIHVIVGGHSHDAVRDKIIVASPENWKTMIGQSGYYGRYLGRYDVVLSDGRLDADKSKWTITETLAAVSLDKKMEELAQKQLEQLADNVGLDHAFVFELMENLDVSSPVMRLRENALGNMVAEAYRYAGKTDIAVVNGGSLRLNRVQPAGNITVNEMLEMMPFDGKVLKISATGSEIRQQMEGSATFGEKKHGDFLQIAGLSVKFDMKGESASLNDVGRATGGRRVVELLVETPSGFVPIEDEKYYTIALTEYLLKRWEFKDKESVMDGKDRDIIVFDTYCGEVLENRKFYPKTDGRISFVE